jgi:hypothetical protein
MHENSGKKSEPHMVAWRGAHVLVLNASPCVRCATQGCISASGLSAPRLSAPYPTATPALSWSYRAALTGAVGNTLSLQGFP